jgi:hypothetical protein
MSDWADYIRDNPERVKGQRARVHPDLANAGSESDLQARVVQQMRQTDHPASVDVYAIEHGVKLPPWIAARIKRQGVRGGLPDITCYYRIEPWCGLMIELKKGSNTLTDLQAAFLQRRVGSWAVAVCWTYESAMEAWHTYLTEPNNFVSGI